MAVNWPELALSETVSQTALKMRDSYLPAKKERAARFPTCGSPGSEAKQRAKDGVRMGHRDRIPANGAYWRANLPRHQSR